MKRRAHGILPVVGAALAMAGCGSSDETIPPREADTLLNELAALEVQFDAGDCVSADATLDELFQTAQGLPGGLEEDVRRLLRRLDNQIGSECSVEETTTTTSETTTTTTEPTTTTTEPTTTTTEPTTTTTEPTTTTTEPTTPGGGGGSGGTGPGGGSG